MLPIWDRRKGMERKKGLPPQKCCPEPQGKVPPVPLAELPSIQTAVVVGKGPTADDVLHNPRNPDAWFFCNEAWKLFAGNPPGGRSYMCRSDRPRDDMDWCRDLPGWVTPVVHCSLRNLYPGGSVFQRWGDIGIPDRKCTAVIAIAVAVTLGAREIEMVGFDRLTSGVTYYHNGLANARNLLGCPDQRNQFAVLPGWVQAMVKVGDRNLASYLR